MKRQYLKEVWYEKEILYVYGLLQRSLGAVVIPSRGAEDRGLDVVAAEYMGKQAQIGKQYALLIGIDRYQEWSPLKNPVKDAREIRDILREHYYIDEFIELYDADATRANIARAFADLQGRLTMHDSLFIYYAGYGYVDPISLQGFWIPVNAGLDEYEQNNWLANSAIRGYIANLKTIHVFLVSDACFSGDILNTDRAQPATIDNAYFRHAYTLVSRLVLTSGSNETVPDESEFSRALKMCLLKNPEVLLDPYMIHNDVRLAVSETTPLIGSLAQASHQDGATFIFFRRDLQPAPQPQTAAASQASQTAAQPQTASAPSDWTPARDFDMALGEKGVTIKKYKGTAQTVNIPAMIDNSPVVEIGAGAFEDCSGLTSISIPAGLTAIGNWAFYGCSGLSSLSIPAGLTAIGNWAFYGCSGLSSLSIPAGLTAIGNWAFYGCSGLTSLSIPAGVTAIGEGAFSGCSGLSSLSIPAGLTAIGDRAFRGCSGLRTISIPAGLTAIGNYAFYGCSGLSSITVDALNTRYSAANGVLFSKDGKTLVCYPAGKGDTSYTIPNSVTAIGNEAFAGCSSLSSISIPNSVTAIGYGAFVGCSSLSSLSIPAGLTAIGDGAFSDCSGLTSLSIPAGVTAIGDLAFSNCSGLSSISIHAGVTAIGDWAFAGCSGLSSLSIPASVSSIGYHAFWGCSSLSSITVDALNTRYSAANGVLFSKDGKTLVRYPEGKTYTSYTIPAGVTAIGNEAFAGCSSLSSISIPNSVTAIGDAAFEGCSRLSSLSIPNSVTTIGNAAFWGCSRLTSVSIPSGVTAIGYEAFYGCSGLSSIRIPNSVTSIGNTAFYGCGGLSSISIPAGVTAIGNRAFRECSGLSSESREAIRRRFGDEVF